MSGGYVVRLDTGELESAVDAAMLNDIGRRARDLGVVLTRGNSEGIEWHMQTTAAAAVLRDYARGLALPKWWRLS